MAAHTAPPAELTQKAATDLGLRHIAMIMDGNRRWARAKNLASVFGHREGVKAFKRAIKAADKFGIKYLTVYAFSTENWGRKKEEVEFLMNLLKEMIKNELQELHGNNVRLRIIGDIRPLPEDLKKILLEAQGFTAENSGLNLQIAINYGSRSEITGALKKICRDIQAGVIESPEEITETLISNYLYTAQIPDPDLLIRTGGEQRLSNYLLWQSAYTEIFVTEVFWPDFDETLLERAIHSFAGRNRRFGKD